MESAKVSSLFPVKTIVGILRILQQCNVHLLFKYMQFEDVNIIGPKHTVFKNLPGGSEVQPLWTSPVPNPGASDLQLSSRENYPRWYSGPEWAWAQAVTAKQRPYDRL